MGSIRLSAAQLAGHLADESPEVRRLVRTLRRVVLAVVPHAAEAVKFHALCYSRPGAPFGAIGGNICMIEVHRGGVVLSFIRGARLADPDGVLRGQGKAKRSLAVPSRGVAAGARVAALIQRAANCDAASAPGAGSTRAPRRRAGEGRCGPRRERSRACGRRRSSR